MSGVSLWARIAVGTAAAVGTVLVVPVPAPAPTRVGATAGVASGAVLGLLLFVSVARRRPRTPRRAQLTVAQLCFLLGWAWVEEVLWRRLLLGGLAAVAGVAVGFLTATVLFALAHPQGRPTQILTGTIFGAAYLGTGRLSAAVASHAVYNLLVAGSRSPAPAGAT